MGLHQMDILGDEPIDFEDAAKHARVPLGPEDRYLEELITTAREYCEQETDRAIVRARYVQTLNRFPTCNHPLTLPRPPLESVEAIEYIDSAGASLTLPAEHYAIAGAGDTAQVWPTALASWPETSCDAPSCVRITFVAGYADPPAQIKHAVRMLVGYWYERREAVVTGMNATELSMAVARMLGHVQWGGYA